MTLQETLARMSELRTELETLAAVEGDLDETQRADWQSMTEEWDALDASRAEMQARKDRLEAVRNASLEPGNVEPIDAPQVIVRDDIYDPNQLNSLNGVERGTYLYDHASRAIESWGDEHGVTAEWQESAAKLIAGSKRPRAKGSKLVAEHILRFGNPDYVDAFYSYLEGGKTNLSEDESRAYRAALNEGTTTQGGFIVPPFLDPSIILTNNGITNPMRSISTVKTIGTQTWKGVTSAGVTAEWTAEAAEVADASPTVAQPTITPIRADAYVQASREMLEDTDIATEIAMLFADAKDRLEGAGFVVGTGSTQPNGVVTAVAGTTASRVAGSSGAAGAADFVLADVYALKNALPPRYRPGASWLGEQTVLNKIRRFGEGVTANAAFWTDLNADIPPLLLGKPVYEASSMDNTIVSGSNDDVLLFGDFSKYYIVDRIGMEVLFNDLVLGSNRRPTGEVAWVCFWRTGGDCVDTNGFRLLRL